MAQSPPPSGSRRVDGGAGRRGLARSSEAGCCSAGPSGHRWLWPACQGSCPAPGTALRALSGRPSPLPSHPHTPSVREGRPRPPQRPTARRPRARHPAGVVPLPALPWKPSPSTQLPSPPPPHRDTHAPAPQPEPEPARGRPRPLGGGAGRTPRRGPAEASGVSLSRGSTPSSPAQPGRGLPVPVDERIAAAPRPRPPPPPSQRRIRAGAQAATWTPAQSDFPPRRPATGRAEGQSAKLHAPWRARAPPGGRCGKGPSRFACSNPCSALGGEGTSDPPVDPRPAPCPTQRERTCV